MANIEQYLPGRMAQIKEFMDLCLAENPEFDDMEAVRKKWLNNKFPTQADEDGIAMFEKILDLHPSDSDTLEDRRFRVLTKLNERLPYTWIQLHRMMAALCGWDGYELKLEHFVLTVYLAMDSRSKLNSVIDMLRDVIPMHILIDIEQAVELFLKVPVYSYSTDIVDIEIVPYQKKNAVFDSKAGIFSGAQSLVDITVVPHQKLKQDFIQPIATVSGLEGYLDIKILPRNS